MLAHAYVKLHRDGLHAGEQSSASVAFLGLAAVPVLFVAFRDLAMEAALHDLFLVSLNLVEAHNVRVGFLHEFLQEAFLDD